jgi:hypothetical protein
VRRTLSLTVTWLGEVWEALARVGQLLGEAEREFLAGNYKTADRKLVEAEVDLARARELQRGAEHVLFETPLMAAADTSSIVDAAVRVVAARGPFTFVDVTLSAGGTEEGLATEQAVEELEVRRPVG